MRKADIIGNPTLLAQWEAKRTRRQARKEAQRPDALGLKGKEGASVRKVFEEVLAGMRKEAETNLTHHYTKLAEGAKIVEGLTHDKATYLLDKTYGLRWGGGYYSNDVTRFQYRLLNFSNDSFMSGITSLKPAAEIKRIIGQVVEDDLRSMFESFILKQTEKVNGILKGRKVHVKSRVYANLEGTFDFVLEDGSKFLMKTQIVWKMSPKGKRFWQFPTTFHNAFKANGTAIKPASEINLKKEM
jgi:hypothetical protein